MARYQAGAYSHSNAPEPTGRRSRPTTASDLRLPCDDPQFHAALPCNTKKCSLLLCRDTPSQRIDIIYKFERRGIGSPCNL